MLTVGTMKELWPRGDQHVAGLIEGIVASAPTVFPKYGLTSDLVVAHAMAQFSEECGAGLEMVENLNYSEQGLLRTFPTHFSGTMAARYAHNPRMIADIAYGGRMGNAPPPSDDGWNRRGRGFSQVTGTDGYKLLQGELDKQGVDIDIMANPDLVSDPRYALLCGVADFVLCGCLPFAQRDDVRGVTKHLNGGYNGLSERISWLGKWKHALGARVSSAAPLRGVAWVQDALNKLGTTPPLAVDGQAGPATEAAIRAFEQAHNLMENGIVDDALCAAIDINLAAARSHP